MRTIRASWGKKCCEICWLTNNEFCPKLIKTLLSRNQTVVLSTSLWISLARSTCMNIPLKGCGDREMRLRGSNCKVSSWVCPLISQIGLNCFKAYEPLEEVGLPINTCKMQKRSHICSISKPVLIPNNSKMHLTPNRVKVNKERPFMYPQVISFNLQSLWRSKRKHLII